MHAQPAAATLNFAPVGTAAATAIGVATEMLRTWKKI
jgi:hypothetical protein